MRFAFDVDGVITEMPELFSAITTALRAAGHYIYILTDFDEHFRDQRVKELAKLNIAYDELIITPHKERFVQEKQVDYAFDDDLEYYANSHRLRFYAFGKKA